jgi:UDP-glucose 4-epimerase
MRYLVTGAAGFLGYHMVSRLAQRPNSDIVAVDVHRHGPPDDAYLELCSRPGVTRLDVDLSHPSQVRDLPDVDVVIHLAALNGTQNFYQRPWQVMRDSSLPTIHLLERYRSSGMLQWVYASSSEIYADAVGLCGLEIPTSEEVPAAFGDLSNPRWSYGYAKGLGEVATWSALRNSECRATILRFHNVFGPRMGSNHFIPDFIERASRGDFSIYGADQTRAYAYIDDAIDQVTALLDAQDQAQGLFNIGSKFERSNRSVALEIMRIMQVEGELNDLGAPVGSVARRCPDLSKLELVIGEIQESPMSIALGNTVNWYQSGTV